MRMNMCWPTNDDDDGDGGDGDDDDDDDDDEHDLFPRQFADISSQPLPAPPALICTHFSSLPPSFHFTPYSHFTLN